jgi:uncharacterized protein YbcI
MARIANEVVGLHKRHRGRGPTQVRAHRIDDLVIVVLREDFSQLERALARDGREQSVREQREAYEAMVETELKEIVETHTGSTVTAFIHAGHHEPDVYVEMFVLSPV